ncbi:MAG: hypothetical protein ACWA41_08675 [Putridiphycobacter sp.]
MILNFLKKSSIRQIVTNKNFLFFTIISILFVTIFEVDPANALVLILLEGVVMAVLGFIFGLFQMDEVNNVVGRFFVGIILLPLNLFFLIVPYGFITIFNRPNLPELDLYYSKSLEEVNMLVYSGGFSDYLVFFETHTEYLYFIGATLIFFVYNHFSKQPDVTMETSAFKATAYCAILALVSLIAFLIAFIFQYFVEGSYPFTFLLIIRLAMAFSK